MTEEKKVLKKKSFSLDYYLTCPMCAVQGTILVSSNDPKHFRCTDCGEDFTIGDVENVVNEWIRYLADMKSQKA